MIRPLPTNDAGRVLRALARLPEGATAEHLACHLYRQPRHPPLLGSYVQKAAARRAWQDACEAARVAAARKITGLLRELTRLGLVEPQGPPRVAAWVIERAVAEEPDIPATWAVDALASRQRLGRGAARLLARLVTESPPSRAALGLSGAGERTYDRLVADGIIVAPSLRTLTERGVLLVAAWVAEEAA